MFSVLYISVKVLGRTADFMFRDGRTVVFRRTVGSYNLSACVGKHRQVVFLWNAFSFLQGFLHKHKQIQDVS